MKASQRGFGVVGLLAMAVVLVAIGAAGYYVWHMQQNASMPPSTATNASQSTSAADSGNTNTPLQPHYLIIKEWGIKVPVSADFSYYASSSQGGAMQINESQLAMREKAIQCPVSEDNNGEVALIIRTTTIEPGPTIWSPKIGGYYYGWPDAGGTAICTDASGYNTQSDLVNPRLEDDQTVLRAAMAYITAE